MADVFISYARDDRDLVRRIAEAVEREGYSVQWDDERPRPGVEAAKAVIVVWSAGAAASQRVRAEADAAHLQGNLIQLSADGRVPPIPFSQIHATAIGDWQSEDGHPGWAKVKESLADLVGAGSAPLARPMPTTPPPAAAGQQWRWLLIGIIAFSILVLAAVGFLLWRGAA